MSLRVVFFDLDDTLFPAEAVYQYGLRAAWKRLSQDHPITWIRFQEIYQRARRETKTQLKSQPAARNRILYFKRLVEILTGSSRPALTLALMDAYDTCWSQIDARPARRLAARLSQRYTLGIVTNQLAGFQLAKLRRIDPDGRYFKYLITSEEVGCEKPDPRFFRAACKRARCQPREALVVGNSWGGDVQGALRAGLRAIYLETRAAPSRLTNRVRQASTLEDVERLLLDPSMKW